MKDDVIEALVPFPDVDKAMLEHAVWNSPKLQNLEKVHILCKANGQDFEAQFCEDEYSFYIGDGCIHASEVRWRRIFPESTLERAANNYLAVLMSPTVRKALYDNTQKGEP